MSDDIAYLSAVDLLQHYRRKSLSPVEVTRAVLDRIEALEPRFNAFCVLDAESAMRDARSSEQRWLRGEPAGRVDGIPVSVKDLILARGWPTRRGSLTIDPAGPWEEDGPPVARMRENGAVLLGKTTTPEFGWKGVTDSPLTGTTFNPWDATRTPGGSSGGAGCAAALGLGPLHIATDGGGSIRIPSAFCGVFGFKPTWGLVPVHPHSPAGTLWHQGPIVRTVSDAVLMLDVIAAPDLRDWYAVPTCASTFGEGIDDGIGGWRIGYSATLGYARLDREVEALFHAGLQRLSDLGAHVEEVDPGIEADPIAIMRPLWATALALAIAPMDEHRRALLERPLLELAHEGTTISALEYRALEQARERFGRSMNTLAASYDLIVTPQMPITAFAADADVPPGTDYRRWWEWSPYTYPFNLTQQPAASVPCGFDRRGLPAALQFVAAKFQDRKVLRAARAFERSQPFRMPARPGEPYRDS